MQEMKYFNEGNDCDICKNQLMTGRDGTVEDCRRRQNGLSCRFEERDIRTWQREEREMSREEYDRLTLMQEVVASNTTGIVESVTQFQKDAVIDEYTQQLIEEGLI